MSIEYLAAAMHADLLPHSRKLVLIGLANHSDGNGRCWPSIRSIGDVAQLTRRNVQKHLTALEEAGWVTRESKYTEGRQTANVYRLELTAITGASVATPRGVASDTPGRRQRHGEGVASDTPGDVASDAPGGVATDAPGTVRRNHQRNRQGNPSTSGSAERYPHEAGEQKTNPPAPAADQEEQPAPEPETYALVEPPHDPPAIHIPAREIGEVPIPESKVQEWEQSFPAIDVRQELQGLRQWSVDNPNRRKKQVIRWCSGRLSAKQEQGRGRGNVRPMPRSVDAIREHNQQVADRWSNTVKTQGDK